MLRTVAIVVTAVLASAVSFAYGLQNIATELAVDRHREGVRFVTFFDYSDSGGYARLSTDDARLLSERLGSKVHSIGIEELVANRSGSQSTARVAVLTREGALQIGLPEHVGNAIGPVAFLRDGELIGDDAASVRFADRNVAFSVVNLPANWPVPSALTDVDVFVVDDEAQLLDNELVDQLEGDAKTQFRENQPNRILFATSSPDRQQNLLEQSLESLQGARRHSAKWETLTLSAEIGTRSGKATMVAIEGLWTEPRWKRAFEAVGSTSANVLRITAALGAITYALLQLLRAAVVGDRLRLFALLGARPSRIAAELVRYTISGEAIASYALSALLGLVLVWSFGALLDVPAHLVPDPIVVAAAATGFAVLLVIVCCAIQGIWAYSQIATGAFFRARQPIVSPASVLFAALCASFVVAAASFAPGAGDLRRSLVSAGSIPVQSLHMLETEYSQFPPPISGIGILRGLNDAMDTTKSGEPKVSLVSALPPFSTTTTVQVHAVGRAVAATEANLVLGSTGFFEVAGIRVIRGESFAKSRSHGLVLSETLANRLFGDLDTAVGRGAVVTIGNQVITFTVIGVAADIPGFSNIVYRNTDISETSQIWTSRLLVSSTSSSAEVAEQLTVPLRLAGLRATRIRPLTDVLAEATRPSRVAVAVFGSLMGLLTIVMGVAITASVLSTVRARKDELSLLWRLGASAAVLFRRTAAGILVGWVVGTTVGMLIVWNGRRLWLEVAETQGGEWAGALVLGACLSGVAAVSWVTTQSAVRLIAQGRT
jgi:hypothetical protein